MLSIVMPKKSKSVHNLITSPLIFNGSVGIGLESSLFSKIIYFVLLTFRDNLLTHSQVKTLSSSALIAVMLTAPSNVNEEKQLERLVSSAKRVESKRSVQFGRSFT